MPSRTTRRVTGPIAVDAMGGDHAPDEAVAGAVAAVREHGVPVVLVGEVPVLNSSLKRFGAVRDISVLDAGNHTKPDDCAPVARRNPSIAVACDLVRDGRAAALVSAGPTGAVVSAASGRLRRVPGASRPAIAAALPGFRRSTVLIDAGATTDPSAEMLVQFALLGSAYVRLGWGRGEPRVGLLNIGTESGKGNRLTRDAESLLARAPIRFVGNVEGGDLLSGELDVVVTDGFTGNVALKSLEGGVSHALRPASAGPSGGRLARMNRTRKRKYPWALGDETRSGAPLLGLEATVVITHGTARAPAISQACVLARNLAEDGITAGVRDLFLDGRNSQ